MRPVVFASRPSALSLDQEYVFNQWHRTLLECGFRVERLLRCQYNADPWEQLKRLLMRADGVLVLGFRQPAGPDTCRQHGTRTSPWLQIEAGMAIMVGLPVLAVPEDNVGDGVFAPATWRGNLSGVPAKPDPLYKIPAGWAEEVTCHFWNRSRVSVPSL